mmetsp:Transcript_25871/g.82393  ORF Transcript_25871/g.82393 Transcript_25871/m.82393 type:complete len:220 (+) Transcript_25871:904-1563(+)
MRCGHGRRCQPGSRQPQPISGVQGPSSSRSWLKRWVVLGEALDKTGHPNYGAEPHRLTGGELSVHWGATPFPSAVRPYLCSRLGSSPGLPPTPEGEAREAARNLVAASRLWLARLNPHSRQTQGPMCQVPACPSCATVTSFESPPNCPQNLRKVRAARYHRRRSVAGVLLSLGPGFRGTVRRSSPPRAQVPFPGHPGRPRELAPACPWPCTRQASPPGL